MNKEKLYNFYYKKQDLCNFTIIVIVMFVGFLIFKDSFNGLLTDKGREMLFPTAIAEGKVLYKDILCIYFPLAFQINALIYKIFGTNLSNLLFAGCVNTIFISFLLYLISKEFLNKSFSLLFSVIFIMAAAFNGTLFNSILPYSNSFTYGVTSFLLGLYLIFRFLKYDEKKCLPFAYLAGGFALACKSEFSLFFLILCLTTFVLKPCKISDNIKYLLCYSVFPFLSFGVLFLQGLSIQELVNAFQFMKKFFTTDSMVYHVTRTGALPSIAGFSMYLPSLCKLSIFYVVSFFAFKFSLKYKYLLPFAFVISAYILNWTNIGTNTILLPIFMSLFFIIKFKSLYQNKPLFVLILASLFINIRMFWLLQLNIYGMLTAHLIVLAFIVVIFEYFPENKFVTKDIASKFIIYMSIIYLTFFTSFNYIQMTKNTTPLTTERGTIYLPKNKAEAVDYAIKYIQQYSTKEQKILVLPEGMAINFLANRPLDYKMPMLDRLYYDAFDENEIIDNLKSADYEMIFVVQGYGLTNFGKPYLYTEENPVMKYIQKNYVNDWKTEYNDGKSNNIMYCFVKPY